MITTCERLLICSLLAISHVYALENMAAVFSEATNCPVTPCGYKAWTTAERNQFQVWTNHILSGLEMELRDECTIYADVACSNKIAAERVYVFYDPNIRSFIKTVNVDVQSLQDGQFDFFSWKTLGDYVKYGQPPVTAALWVRVHQGHQEEVLRMHIFRPGDYVFRHFGRDHIYVDGLKGRSYLDRIPSSVFSSLPWTEDAVFSRRAASAISMLMPGATWTKKETPKVSHFHVPGFHEGYLRSEFSFPRQRKCRVKLGYVDQELFDVCFSFCSAQPLSSEGGKPTSCKEKVIDLNVLASKESGLPDLSRFTAFAEKTGCALIYALKYSGPTQRKVSEYFFSSSDSALQFSAFEMEYANMRPVWEFSYYIDVARFQQVRIPSFFRKFGCLVESTGKIVQEGTQKLRYRLENKEQSSIRLICLQEDVSRGVFLARQPDEYGEYWLFQDGNLKSIKKYLSADAFSDDQFVSPSPLTLDLPVIGRTGCLSLRPDCQ